jgi:hypothetical protein
MRQPVEFRKRSCYGIFCSKHVFSEDIWQLEQELPVTLLPILEGFDNAWLYLAQLRTEVRVGVPGDEDIDAETEQRYRA